MIFVYDIGKSRWEADFGREALKFGRDHFTIYTGNYVITCTRRDTGFSTGRRGNRS